MAFQNQISQSVKVSQTFRHLLAFHQQEASMKPEVRKRLASSGFRLGNFVFVMRKNQVFAAGMQVETLAQFCHRHDRTLDMPSRTPRPNLALPRSFTRLRRFPKSEVSRIVLFIFVYFD